MGEQAGREGQPPDTGPFGFVTATSSFEVGQDDLTTAVRCGTLLSRRDGHHGQPRLPTPALATNRLDTAKTQARKHGGVLVRTQPPNISAYCTKHAGTTTARS